MVISNITTHKLMHWNQKSAPVPGWVFDLERLDLKIAKKMALLETSRQMPETMKKAIKARRRLCLRERVMVLKIYVYIIYPWPDLEL